MVDFHEEFTAANQDDARLHTFVIHVPTLGAKENNVPAAMELLDGPRVSHYWNESGDLGNEFSKTLNIEGTYAWDVWMVYATDVMWETDLPPEPDYWQHQLGVDQGQPFDAAAFAAVGSRLMDQAGR